MQKQKLDLEEKKLEWQMTKAKGTDSDPTAIEGAGEVMIDRAEILNSIRGHTGGYILADRPENINIGKVLGTLGGRLYDSNFCEKHTGVDSICTHTVDCTMRSLWTSLQNVIDKVLVNLTLKDLLHMDEGTLAEQLHEITENIFKIHEKNN